MKSKAIGKVKIGGNNVRVKLMFFKVTQRDEAGRPTHFQFLFDERRTMEQEGIESNDELHMFFVPEDAIVKHWGPRSEGN